MIDILLIIASHWVTGSVILADILGIIILRIVILIIKVMNSVHFIIIITIKIMNIMITIMIHDHQEQHDHDHDDHDDHTVGSRSLKKMQPFVRVRATSLEITMSYLIMIRIMMIAMIMNRTMMTVVMKMTTSGGANRWWS